MKYATSLATAAVLVLAGSEVSAIVLPPGATPVHPPAGIEILKERLVLPPGSTPVHAPDGTEILKERELLRPGETVIHPPPGFVIARQVQPVNGIYGDAPEPTIHPGIVYDKEKRRIPAAIPTSFATVPIALPSDEPIIPLKPGTNIPIAGKKRMAIGENAETGETFQQMQQEQEQEPQSHLIPDLPGEPKTALKRSSSIELPSEIVPDLPGEPKQALKQRYVLPSGATAVPIPHPSGLHIVALTGQEAE